MFKAVMLQILLVSGGFNNEGRTSSLDSTETFDLSLGSWRAGAVLPSPMDSLSAANIDNCQALVPSPVPLDPNPKQSQIQIQVQLGLG